MQCATAYKYMFCLLHITTVAATTTGAVTFVKVVCRRSFQTFYFVDSTRKFKVNFYMRPLHVQCCKEPNKFQ